MVNSTIEDGIALRLKVNTKAIVGECYVCVTAIANQGRYLNNSRVVKITQDPTTAEYDDLPRTKWSHDALHEISDTKFIKITSNETQIEHDLGNIFHSVTGPFPSFTDAKEYANRYLGPVSRNANNDDTSFWGEVPANIRNV